MKPGTNRTGLQNGFLHPLPLKSSPASPLLQKLRSHLKEQGIKISNKLWLKAQLMTTTCQGNVKVMGAKVKVQIWLQKNEQSTTAGIMPSNPGRPVQTRLGKDYPEILVPNHRVSMATLGFANKKQVV